VIVTAPPTRSLRIILSISIALNLFLLAFVAGQRWRARGLEMMAIQSAAPMLGGRNLNDRMPALQRLYAALPPEDASILREAVEARMPALLAAQQGFLDAAEEVRQAIAHDPLVPEALQASITAARRERQTAGPLLDALMMDAIPRMSAEGRRILSNYRPAS